MPGVLDVGRETARIIAEGDYGGWRPEDVGRVRAAAARWVADCERRRAMIADARGKRRKRTKSA